MFFECPEPEKMVIYLVAIGFIGSDLGAPTALIENLAHSDQYFESHLKLAATPEEVLAGG